MSEQEAKKQKTEEPAAEAAGAAAAGATPAAAEAKPASSGDVFAAGEATGVKGAVPSTPEEVAAAVKRQVEYYFSEGNFSKDKFMQAETAKTKEQWVNISVMATFNRMKALVPSLDLALISAALRDSTVLEVSEDGSSVRREKSRWEKAIGGAMYSGRQEVMARAKAIIEEGKASSPEGEISEEAQAFVLDLLKSHANPAEKIGAGVKVVKVGSNPEFPDTKCFVIERVDGSVVDFSYIKCVTNLYPEAAEGGKGGGQRKGDRKRKADSSADGEGSGHLKQSAEEEIRFTKGCILVVKDLAEGSARGTA